MKNSPGYTLILASSSPRRKALLRDLGAQFKVILPQEDAEPDIIAHDISSSSLHQELCEDSFLEKQKQRLKDSAKAKAKSVRNSKDLPDNAVIIAADTVVVLGHTVLGKPKNPQEAVAMLKGLSGAFHYVLTGVCVWNAFSEQVETDCQVTKVFFKDLSSKDIESYVKSGAPLDKAGAYGIQELGGLLISKIEGCYFNVVGLPLGMLKDMLDGAGCDFMADCAKNTKSVNVQ